MLDFESCKKVHAGNGLTREWSYDFPLPDVSYMKVYVSGPGGAPELISSGYRVDAEARRVVYPASADADALPAGWTLTLMRELPLLQPVKLLNQQGRFFADDTEKGLDRGVMMIQQLAEVAGRAITAPVDDSLSAEELAAQVVENHERYDEIAQKHGETLSARDAAQLSASSAVSSADAALAAKASAEMSAEAAEAARDAVFSASSVPPWDASTVYGYPDTVCCVDGHTYRCIGTDVSGAYPPESDMWVRITVIQQAGTYDMESGGTFGDAAAAFVSGGSF